MRIKKIEKRVRDPKSIKVTYQDLEMDRVYGRVVDGLSWPLGEKPGAIVTIAEAADQDHSLLHSPFHCYVLDEFYSQELEELYRKSLLHRDVFCVEKIVGNPDNSIYPLWQQCGGDSSRISISEPPNLEIIDLNYVTQLVRKRTSLQKTLHFDIGKGSSLPGHLALLRDEDTEKRSLESFPPVAALGYALAELESPLTQGTFTPRRTRRARNPRHGR